MEENWATDSSFNNGALAAVRASQNRVAYPNAVGGLLGRFGWTNKDYDVRRVRIQLPSMAATNLSNR